MLTFEELREANIARDMDIFGSELHEKPVEYWGLAICGEAGELANLLKKAGRSKENVSFKQIYKKEVTDEIADILIYCDILCTRLGVKLEDVVVSKFNEVSVKYKSKIWLNVGPPKVPYYPDMLTALGFKVDFNEVSCMWSITHPELGGKEDEGGMKWQTHGKIDAEDFRACNLWLINLKAGNLQG